MRHRDLLAAQVPSVGEEVKANRDIQGFEGAVMSFEEFLTELAK